jgi:hypothetical protein
MYISLGLSRRKCAVDYNPGFPLYLSLGFLAGCHKPFLLCLYTSVIAYLSIFVRYIRPWMHRGCCYTTTRWASDGYVFEYYCFGSLRMWWSSPGVCQNLELGVVLVYLTRGEFLPLFLSSFLILSGYQFMFTSSGNTNKTQKDLG